MKKLTLFIIIGFLSFTASKAQVKKTNIILIMVDDMGYADIGCYGGEIPTPNIDQLAKNGIRFSQFYNTARCCPTRASLLTGLFPHQTGIGHMTNPPNAPDRYSDWNSEGYQGYLNRNCLTLAEGLKEAGYHTYMTGKWHLGYHEESRWPLQRGFEKFYGSIPGACSYFWPNGNRPVTFMNEHLPPPDSTTYYTTDAFTDYAIQFIDEQQDDSPFFLYLAYNAPHWPLHAKKEDIKKFIGKYMHGWDEVRKKRLEKQIEMGLLDPETILSERDHRVRPWVEVSDSQKVLSDYRMAVYAAQIYSVDYNIGKLVEKLKAEDQYENTLILFLSDNGGCAEMYDEFGSKPQSYINKKNYSGAVSYGIGWANASNTPFYNYKVKIDEGGISTLLIAHWPEGIINQEGKINHQPGYLIDIAPTLYEIAGFNYPRTFHQGNEIPSLKGNSLLPIFKGKETHPHEFMYWEHQNNKAIRKGKWKASMDATASTWKLFNLEEDRIESKNLADQYPELVEELEQKWEDWAKSHKVLPKKN